MAQSNSTPPPAGETDPSMDDILASIRRILSDEEKTAKSGSPDDVLMLDPSMVVDDAAADDPPERPDESHAMTEPNAPYALQSRAEHTGPRDEPVPSSSASDAQSRSSSDGAPPDEAIPQPEPLVAAAAAAAAASSVGALMRTLVAERNAVVHRGGPSIEDLVREEIRPLLKDWLDTHLPPVVERLVRAEIERVVGRITG